MYLSLCSLSHVLVCLFPIIALRSKETGPNVAAIGGGVGGVFAILVVIGILVLVIIYRRR